VFVSQDPYNGVLSDPVSLHKYLYANANPVMYSDPTGRYAALADMSAAMAINSILDSIVYANYMLLLKGLTVGVSAMAIGVSTYSFIDRYYSDIVKLAEDILSGEKSGSDVADEVKDTAVSNVPNIYIAKGSKPTESKKPDEKKRKKPKGKATHKEKADDVPSWVKKSGETPYEGENGNEFAKRLCDDRFGEGQYPKGPKSDYNIIKKWGDRGFE
jgi:hypothetical protein